MAGAYTLGLDFGTNSVRAVVVDCADGQALGTAVAGFASGDRGVILDARDPHLARQHPGDYLTGLERAAGDALAQAESQHGFSRNDVVGIGSDTTGSTPLPVDANCVPLALDKRWRDHPAAQAWLWKDHTGAGEAAAITETARRHAPQYLAPIGGTYSAEWFWAKIWHCLKVAPDVFAAATSWIELADFVPAALAGVESPRDIRRSICAAGHKAMYARAWGGLPDATFLARLDPKLADLRGRLYDEAYAPDRPAGQLSPAWAKRLGLTAGIPIAMGGFDAHYGAVGAGVETGTLVKIIGTSTCDIAIA
ncbi:MAG TPA: FGGY family carbohydrate kinase, partial [Gemmatimonadales bacterium]|nr:FGGY family carbohydrate kinase [Gemmatimonadales bacterium]